MKTVVVIGEIVVEILAETVGEGFAEPLALSGPYPSGAPAIFIDQVARLGQPCGIVSCVGDDDFGRLNRRRLQADGVDVSAVAVDPTRPTGTAFVRYRCDGGRDFVFNIAHSASGRTRRTAEADALLSRAGHLHVTGASLFSTALTQLTLDAIRQVRAQGGTVSFDPNVRKEMPGFETMRAAMGRILDQTDLFLPSGAELTLLTEAQDEAGALTELTRRGIAVVHKQGAAGARYVDAGQDIFAPGLAVDEVDPTGAGDCFGGAFVTFWLRGATPRTALAHAVAAGAHAVTRRGPMEGVGRLADLQTLLTRHTEPS